MSKVIGRLAVVVALSATLVTPLFGIGEGQGYTPEMQGEIGRMMEDLQRLGDEKARGEQNLRTFDTFEREVFNGRLWARLPESHSPDVTVHWPCGRQTEGLDAYADELKGLFVHAPDTGIKTHVARIASGGYTAVTGVMTGTFSQPMAKPDGSAIAPTGKQFSVGLCTVARWQDGVIVELWLYYDSAAYLRQMGIGQ